MVEMKERLLYLDSEPVRSCRAAAPGRQLPPETRCASSSAPAVQKRINKAARKTNGPVRTGGFAADESHETFRQSEIPCVLLHITFISLLKSRGPRESGCRLLCRQEQMEHTNLEL